MKFSLPTYALEELIYFLIGKAGSVALDKYPERRRMDVEKNSKGRSNPQVSF